MTTLFWAWLWGMGLFGLTLFLLRGWFSLWLIEGLETASGGYISAHSGVDTLFIIANVCCLTPLRWLNNFMPFFIIPLIVPLGLALATQRYSLATLYGVNILLIGLTVLPFFWPRTSLTTEPTLTVMSYNVWRSGKRADYGDVAAIIKQVHPDIALLQEITEAQVLPLRDALIDLYPHTYMLYEDVVITSETTAADIPNRQQPTWQFTISRYPIEPLKLNYAQGRVQKMRLALPNESIQVWNVHPIHPLTRHLWYQQYRQIKRLSEEAAAVEEPLIIGGDFNATPFSDTYQLLRHVLSEAQREVGWGFGFTFPSPVKKMHYFGFSINHPVVRIDHLFYNHAFQATKAEALTNSGQSDHLPIVVALSLAEKNPLK